MDDRRNILHQRVVPLVYCLVQLDHLIGKAWDFLEQVSKILVELLLNLLRSQALVHVRLHFIHFSVFDLGGVACIVRHCEVVVVLIILVLVLLASSTFPPSHYCYVALRLLLILPIIPGVEPVEQIGLRAEVLVSILVIVVVPRLGVAWL